jgi:hypothetical protein
MTALAAMARLQRLGAHLAHGEPLPAGDAAAIGQAIEQFLDGREPYGDRALYEALGLALAAGEDDPRTVLRFECRDQLSAAEIARMPGETLAARAREFRRRLSEYFHGDWRRDRTAPCCPYAADTENARFWRILRTDPNVLSVRRLRDIVGKLAAKGGLFVANDLADIGKGSEANQKEGMSHAIVEARNSSSARPTGRFSGAVAGSAGRTDAAPPDRRAADATGRRARARPAQT